MIQAHKKIDKGNSISIYWLLQPKETEWIFYSSYYSYVTHYSKQLLYYLQRFCTLGIQPEHSRDGSFLLHSVQVFSEKAPNLGAGIIWRHVHSHIWQLMMVQPIWGYYNGHKSSTCQSNKRPKRTRNMKDVYEKKFKVLLQTSINRKYILHIWGFKKIKNIKMLILPMLICNLNVMSTKIKTGFFFSGKASWFKGKLH